MSQVVPAPGTDITKRDATKRDDANEKAAEMHLGPDNAMAMLLSLDDHFLATELTKARTHAMAKDAGLFVLVLLCAVAAVAAPRFMLEDAGGDFISSDNDLRVRGLCHLLMSVPGAVSLLWLLAKITSGSTALAKARGSTACAKAKASSAFGISTVVIVVLVQARKATIALTPMYEAIISDYVWQLLSLAIVVSFCQGLEMVYRAISSIAEAREEGIRALEKDPPAKHEKSHPAYFVAKWRLRMKNFCEWQDPAADAVYTFEKPGSPMQVLQSIIWIYFALAKTGAVSIYFLNFVGVTKSDIVWVILAGGISALILTLNLSNTLRNLVSLVLSNAFYVGEIISLHKPGGAPPDNPGIALTGFVESVTITHVVLRDFKRKQTWITHENFMKYNISNWTRRPCKTIRIEFAVSSTVADASKVKKLATFSRKWIEQHPKVDANGYIKSVIADAKNGVKLELIFSPLPREKANPIKQDFIVALVSAAKRLGLPVVPKELMTTFPEAGQTGIAQTEHNDDVLPDMSDLLPTTIPAKDTDARSGGDGSGGGGSGDGGGQPLGA